MPQFFIDRPIFAWVIAILITLAGVVAMLRLPAESYPDIAPPQINVSANYPGANAETVERTVTQVIEQQLTGLDRLLYFTAVSNSNGGSQITLSFESGTNPDLAAVQTQNRVAVAEPRLPFEVNQQGVTITKASTSILMAIALRSSDPSLDSGALNNLAASQIIDQIQRISGVGAVNLFGSEYAMRIWLNPDQLHAYSLSAASVLATVRGQNVQFASGSIGARPAVPGQQISASVMAEGRFTSAKQFEDIVLRTDANGATVRLKDVARVALGPSQYNRDTRVDGEPVASFGVQLQPGANALEVAERVTTRMTELESSLPAGVTWTVPYDTTTFIRISIREVAFTLVGAVVLVFLVMLVFLQNLRATLIPTLVVPVALMGAFIGMALVGFSINQLSLFGMALAIGIVVDDAIVVIESVERLMREEGLSPKEATRKALSQISSAIVTITVVLAAVFIPSALQTGSVGAIYRQFALTIAISMLFSAFLALSFTPALCATLLRPTHARPNFVFRWFNLAFARSQAAYQRRVQQSVHHTPRWMAAFAVLLILTGWLFTRLPGSFLPEEDQGFTLLDVQLPAGATLDRTMDVMQRAGEYMKQHEAFQSLQQIGGFGFAGQGENTGRAFIRLKPWDERDSTAMDFIRWANANISPRFTEGRVSFANLPTVRGLGQFGGFDMFLEDRSGQGYQALYAAQKTLIDKAAASPVLTSVRAGILEEAPRLDLTLDRVQAQSMGLAVGDVYTAIQLMLAPVYANDFFNQGRVQRVLLQADAPYRMGPEALSHFYVPSNSAGGAESGKGPAMIPLSTVVKSSWTVAPPSLTRYNGYPAIEITGSNTAAYSSGQAMAEMQSLVASELPTGFSIDWAGQSLQEILSAGTAPLLFAFSILVVYLCLSALYESWSIPIAVLLAVPVGVLGAVGAALLRGLPNDIFFKVGLITIIGLSAKNAILIVEFAVTEQRAGRNLHEAVLEAARLRLRPIIMTSFAFILGVMPLVLSSGAGANARRAIGTGVAGGMLSAALLGVLLVPVFYVAVRRLGGDKSA